MKGLLLSYQHGMWDVVLNRTKTNTRRMHKTLAMVNDNPDNYELIGIDHAEDSCYARFKPKNGGKIVECRARYKLGEISFLQEPTMNLKGLVTDQDMIMYQYPDDKGETEAEAFALLIDKAVKKGGAWGNKMFMPESEARFYIKIKRIEVERLADISEADCLAEGIGKNGTGYFHTINGKKTFFDTAQKAYFSLYKIINRNSPDNPWVFSYHFERCLKGE